MYLVSVSENVSVGVSVSVYTSVKTIYFYAPDYRGEKKILQNHRPSSLSFLSCETTNFWR